MKKTLLSFILLSTVSISAFAQCTETHAPSLFIGAQTGYVAGQSFTAPCSGLLNYIQVTANTTGTVPAGTLNIYPGNSVTAQPIHTQAFNAITIANVGDPVRINISGTVPITNANQYTATFFMNLDVQADNTYTGGHAWQGTTPTAGISVAFEADITLATGVNEVTASDAMVYPNPATDVLNITTDEQIMTATIYSINGALVKTTGDAARINIADLDKGMYILTVQTDQGVTQNRFIKE